MSNLPRREPDVQGGPAFRACPRCGGLDFDTEPADPPHFAVVRCANKNCRRFLRWIGRPITVETAREFVMPFGKHKGCKLAEVPRDYLEWLANCHGMSPRIVERCRVLLSGKGGSV